MKRTLSLLLALLPIILLTTNCSTSDEDGAIIQGVVTNSTSGSPLVDAIVQISSPAELAGNFVRTDSTGSFVFQEINISTVTDIEFTVSLTDYEQLVRTVTATPGQNVTVNFQLIPESTDDGSGDGGGDGEEVEGPPEEPASIVLLSVSETAINIRGTGGVVNSTMVFQVLDSAGRALDLSNPVDVNFSIIKGPGGGEAVTPTVVTTNDEGKAVTALVAGDSAGVVRVEAVVQTQTTTIRSTPILIAINGGFPDPDRFFIATEFYNVEGFGIVPAVGGDGFRYDVTASVGDLYGNPVKPGTAVDFRTRYGGIIQGSTTTNDEGLATVTLRPDGSQPTNPSRGVGFIEVEAKTVDANNDYITQTMDMLFTTRRALITLNPGSIDIPADGSQNFTLTVTDLNLNPMAAGTVIAIQVPEGLNIPDAIIELADNFNPGVGSTVFNFVVNDIDNESSEVQETTLSVVVTTPSGSETTLSITGQRAKSRPIYTFKDSPLVDKSRSMN